MMVVFVTCTCFCLGNAFCFMCNATFVQEGAQDDLFVAAGTPYKHVTCAGRARDEVCSRTVAWQVANLTRVALLGLYLIWMGIITSRGIRDMQRLPYGIGRS